MRKIRNIKQFLRLKEGTPVLFYYNGFHLGSVSWFCDTKEDFKEMLKDGDIPVVIDWFPQEIGDGLCLTYGNNVDEEQTNLVYVISKRKRNKIYKEIKPLIPNVEVLG